MSNDIGAIRIYGDSVLRKHAETVTVFDEAIKEFTENMMESMFDHNGVGLAAPQVGLSKKIIIVDHSFGEKSDESVVMVNPEIHAREGKAKLEEGCLSIPDVFEDVTRAEWISFSYSDINGNEIEAEAEDFLARIIQHEIDHLDGILFVDRIGSVAKVLIASTLKNLSSGAMNS